MSFDGVPTDLKADIPEWCRRLARVTNSLLQGKSNNVGILTLTANAGSTVLTLAKGRLGVDTVIHLQPKTANAAAAITTTYESSRDVGAGEVTFAHTNNAQHDKTFWFTLIG